MSYDPNAPRNVARSRRSTGLSQQSRRSHRSKFNTWATSHSSNRQTPRDDEAEEPPPRTVWASYPVYKLEWYKLEEFLLSLWPEETFAESVEGDRYVFKTPYPGLTEDDRKAIARLRSDDQPCRESASPEPQSATT